MSYKFFQNKACEYFPCHQGADPERFNCLFCFCPLYALGEKCGGNFRYTEGGIKDCSDCRVPHVPEISCAVFSRMVSQISPRMV